jgi:hypothetical protein
MIIARRIGYPIVIRELTFTKERPVKDVVCEACGKYLFNRSQTPTPDDHPCKESRESFERRSLKT